MYSFSLKKLSLEQKKLRKRILELSHDAGLSHLGSCFTAVDIIDAVYTVKKKNDIFILSNGHAGIAWYAVLEKYGHIPHPKITKKFNIHPDRNPQYDIHVSTGSLGQGLPIALGMAMADSKRTIYCMLSDGECAEGSIWEALRVGFEKKVTNLKIIINANGWSAYDRVDLVNLKKRLKAFGYQVKNINGHDSTTLINACRQKNSENLSLLFAHTSVAQFPFLTGQDAHYYVMEEEDYIQAMEALV